jgi:hypothetical protein
LVQNQQTSRERSNHCRVCFGVSVGIIGIDRSTNDLGRDSSQQDIRNRKQTTRNPIISCLKGQAAAEFALVIFIFALIMFATLELGIVTYEKLALSSTVREVARMASVEGGFTQRTQEVGIDLLTSFGLDLENITLDAWPKQAIYGTTINVEASYEHRVLSPPVAMITGRKIIITAKAVTRSEFVPR